MIFLVNNFLVLTKRSQTRSLRKRISDLFDRASSALCLYLKSWDILPCNSNCEEFLYISEKQLTSQLLIDWKLPFVHGFFNYACSKILAKCATESVEVLVMLQFDLFVKWECFCEKVKSLEKFVEREECYLLVCFWYQSYSTVWKWKAGLPTTHFFAKLFEVYSVRKKLVVHWKLTTAKVKFGKLRQF